MRPLRHFFPHYNHPYPDLNPGGKFRRLSEEEVARSAGFAVRVFGVAAGCENSRP
jgi:hypothetical protein